ncbi:hypothetical protein [Rubrivirga sp.]|uniref:hypothetical protein n=1 Tax=Rubrivirga sp. TaxID=1885344 RepID=UPI003C726207
MSRYLALLLASAAFAPALHAQTGELRRVVLEDGTVLVGYVQDESADPLVIVTESGIEQRVPQDRVAEITALLDGQFTRYDPASTRMFFSPTARSLGNGQRRFSAYYLFPSFAVGVTDRLDVSVGSTIPLITSGGIFLGVNGNAKVTLTERDGFAAAVGGSATVPISTESFDAGAIGTVYGLATFGGEAGAVTLGAYGFYQVGFGDGSDLADGTALLVGLDRQISDRFKLISENYLVLAFADETEVAFGTLSGVRFFGDRLAADVAVALGASGGEFSTVPIPYLGMSYTF